MDLGIARTWRADVILNVWLGRNSPSLFQDHPISSKSSRPRFLFSCRTENYNVSKCAFLHSYLHSLHCAMLSNTLVMRLVLFWCFISGKGYSWNIFVWISPCLGSSQYNKVLDRCCIRIEISGRTRSEGGVERFCLLINEVNMWMV